MMSTSLFTTVILWDRGHHHGCHKRSRKCLPFRSTWFDLWLS